MAIVSSGDNKCARLSCRISATIKNQVEAAARMLGLTVSEFAETAFEEKAQSVLAENEHILVSERAFEDFVAAIFGEPGKPSKKLLAAVELYETHPQLPARP